MNIEVPKPQADLPVVKENRRATRQVHIMWQQLVAAVKNLFTRVDLIEESMFSEVDLPTLGDAPGDPDAAPGGSTTVATYFRASKGVYIDRYLNDAGTASRAGPRFFLRYLIPSYDSVSKNVFAIYQNEVTDPDDMDVRLIPFKENASGPTYGWSYNAPKEIKYLYGPEQWTFARAFGVADSKVFVGDSYLYTGEPFGETGSESSPENGRSWLSYHGTSITNTLQWLESNAVLLSTGTSGEGPKRGLAGVFAARAIDGGDAAIGSTNIAINQNNKSWGKVEALTAGATTKIDTVAAHNLEAGDVVCLYAMPGTWSVLDAHAWQVQAPVTSDSFYISYDSTALTTTTGLNQGTISKSGQAWGAYIEGIRGVNYTGGAVGIELECANNSSTALDDIWIWPNGVTNADDPTGEYLSTLNKTSPYTGALGIATGADGSINRGSWNTNFAIQVGNNSAGSGTITSVSTGATTTINTGEDHNLRVGHKIRLTGGSHADWTTAKTVDQTVTSIPTDTQFVVSLNSTGFSNGAGDAPDGYTTYYSYFQAGIVFATNALEDRPTGLSVTGMPAGEYRAIMMGDRQSISWHHTTGTPSTTDELATIFAGGTGYHLNLKAKNNIELGSTTGDVQVRGTDFYMGDGADTIAGGDFFMHGGELVVQAATNTIPFEIYATGSGDTTGGATGGRVFIKRNGTNIAIFDDAGTASSGVVIITRTKGDARYGLKSVTDDHETRIAALEALHP